jgi:cytochrome c oxidase assembly protein subunit 15
LSSDKVPAWLRGWAVLTACAALPLVTLGAEVTTKQVGMADPSGYRAVQVYLSTLFDEHLPAGLKIEHGHRLAGTIVGLACIVLAIGLTLQARGWFHRSLGWFALIAVSLQGGLGIIRVNLHDYHGMGPTFALIHGCCAQLVFVTLVAVAVLCSRAWNAPPPPLPNGLRAASLGLCVLVYCQVVLGAILRHLLEPLAQRAHLLGAFAVVLGVAWLVAALWQAGGPTRRFGQVLLALVIVQLVLGVEAWIGRFGAAQLPDMVPSSPGLDLVRSGHHVVGTLIFSATVALALMLNRRPVSDALAVPAPVRMEGAA